MPKANALSCSLSQPSFDPTRVIKAFVVEGCPNWDVLGASMHDTGRPPGRNGLVDPVTGRQNDGALGMNARICRRDFLNSMLLASGGALLSSLSPLQLLAQQPGGQLPSW